MGKTFDRGTKKVENRHLLYVKFLEQRLVLCHILFCKALFSSAVNIALLHGAFGFLATATFMILAENKTS